jgi:hypothetical protein
MSANHRLRQIEKWGSANAYQTQLKMATVPPYSHNDCSTKVLGDRRSPCGRWLTALAPEHGGVLEVSLGLLLQMLVHIHTPIYIYIRIYKCIYISTYYQHMCTPIGYWKIGLRKITVTKRLEYAARMESALGLLSLVVIIGLPNSRINASLRGILQLRFRNNRSSIAESCEVVKSCTLTLNIKTKGCNQQNNSYTE